MTRRVLRDQPQPRPPGRNDPCPCGSGRKYKRCHLEQLAKVLPNSAAVSTPARRRGTVGALLAMLGLGGGK